jgi:plasmid replication initiation protein
MPDEPVRDATPESLPDRLNDAPLKDERSLMEFPFFALEKKRTAPLVYEDGRVRIRVTGGEKGVATIWDKEVLIFVASIINDRIERGLPAERTLRFRAREFLRLSGRGTEGAAYRSLEDALDRLRSTMVKTSLFEGTRRDRQAFGWIDSYRIAARELRGGREVMGHVEVTLNEWTFQAILAGRRLLTISPAYFRLTSSLERRLYELTRKHCGQQREWRIGLPRLAEKVGTDRELRFFKRELLRIIERDTLPEYRLAIEIPPSGGSRVENLTAAFMRREG